MSLRDGVIKVVGMMEKDISDREYGGTVREAVNSILTKYHTLLSMMLEVSKDEVFPSTIPRDQLGVPTIIGPGLIPPPPMVHPGMSTIHGVPLPNTGQILSSLLMQEKSRVDTQILRSTDKRQQVEMEEILKLRNQEHGVVEVIGPDGPSNPPDYIESPSGMPIGAKTFMFGRVYRLTKREDNSLALVYDKQQTEQVQSQHKGL